MEIRQAQKDETEIQKALWKKSFGDDDKYIEFYYANKYQAEQTILLFKDNDLASMLTMIPTFLATADNKKLPAVMFYGIATDPKYQGHGFATKLINYCNDFLAKQDIYISLLVPASKNLFGFYYKLGYRANFYLKEISYTSNNLNYYRNIDYGCRFMAVSAEEYNSKRNALLAGRLYVSYLDEDILYQKKLAQVSGTDIYIVNVADTFGCVVAERVNSMKVVLKEVLLPKDYLLYMLKNITTLIPAAEYVVRKPGFDSQSERDLIRPFGMIRCNNKELAASVDNFGYLGLAFD